MSPAVAAGGGVGAIFTHWQQVMNHPEARLDKNRRQWIRSALAMGYSVGDCCQAITGCSLTQHNMGHNAKGERYDGIHIIFKSADQIERFMQNAISPPRPQGKAEQRLQNNTSAAQAWLEASLTKRKNKMELADKKRFSELMAGLAQTFATDIAKQDLENYWRLLKTYPLIQVEQAMIEYCISPEGHAFMPKPSEIVATLRGKQSEQSLLAWIKVTQGIRQCGAGKTVVFDDPLIHAVITDLGGWIRLCHLTDRELRFQQREFERLYVCYLQRSVCGYPRRLSGIVDTVNAAEGYTAEQNPVLLGDSQKAAKVYQNGSEHHALPTQPISLNALLTQHDEKRSLQQIEDESTGESHDD